MLIKHTFKNLPLLKAIGGSVIPPPFAKRAWKNIITQRLYRLTDNLCEEMGYIDADRCYNISELMYKGDTEEGFDFWSHVHHAEWDSSAYTTEVTFTLELPGVWMDSPLNPLSTDMAEAAWHNGLQDLNKLPRLMREHPPVEACRLFDYDTSREGSLFWNYVDKNNYGIEEWFKVTPFGYVRLFSKEEKE